MDIQDLKPVFESVEKTGRYVADQGYTYNSDIAYNEDVYYGGAYGNDGISPILKEVYDYKV